MNGPKLVAIAEDLIADVIFDLQFDRSGDKNVVSGHPGDYLQYVARSTSGLRGSSLLKVATYVWANVESYIDDNLLFCGEQIRHGQAETVLPLYQAALAYKNFVDSPEQLMGAVMVALRRRLSASEEGLITAVFEGDQTAIMESLTEVSPVGAYMAPTGLPAPISPGETYVSETTFGTTPPMLASKRAIPIKLVGQWGKPPPRIVRDWLVPPGKRKAPSQLWEEKFARPGWLQSFERIVSWVPTASVARALEESGLPDVGSPTYEQADEFMKLLLKQPYLGASKEYVAWWLTEHGTGVPEPEPELPGTPYVPWTER